MEQNIDNESLLDKVISTPEFSSIPAVTMKVLEMLEDDDSVDIRELAKLIETDPSLTLKLIRVANSPLFAISGNISSVKQSITTLGLNRTTNIVLGISIFSKLIYSSRKDLMATIQQYWKHASSTSTVAKSFAKRLGLSFKEYEFIGGLLHDIGKLAMLQYDSNMYLDVASLVNNDLKKDFEAEQSVFGFSHDKVAVGIANKWKLPNMVSSVMQYHCNFLQAPDDMKNIVAVVGLANTFCDIWGAGFFEGNTVVKFEELPEWLHLKGTTNVDIDFEQISFELEKDFKEASDFLDIVSSTK